jgi:hypothetical protein
LGHLCSFLSACEIILLISNCTSLTGSQHHRTALHLSSFWSTPGHPSRFLIPISIFFLLIIKSGLHQVPKTWNSQRKKKKQCAMSPSMGTLMYKFTRKFISVIW